LKEAVKTKNCPKKGLNSKKEAADWNLNDGR
jgi:hypothetical protein